MVSSQNTSDKSLPKPANYYVHIDGLVQESHNSNANTLS